MLAQFGVDRNRIRGQGSVCQGNTAWIPVYTTLSNAPDPPRKNRFSVSQPLTNRVRRTVRLIVPSARPDILPGPRRAMGFSQRCRRRPGIGVAREKLLVAAELEPIAGSS